MEYLTPEQISSVKGRGFLRNRNTDCFSGRVVGAGGVFTTEQLLKIVQCAQLYGSGKVAFTSRLTAEIVGIPYEKIGEACEYFEMADCGLMFGGTGPKIRPITACKGTTCVFGSSDTQGLAALLHQKYYLGWAHIPLPNKFKIAVGGCPNSCMKPSLNDFGIEARRIDGATCFKIYVGGAWGRHTRVGTALSRFVKQEELFSILDKVLGWYQDNAQPRERLGAVIDRMGINALEAELAL